MQSVKQYYDRINRLYFHAVRKRIRGSLMYLPDSRALFLHIPRTGGEWIKTAIDLCGIRYELRKNRRAGYHRRSGHALLPWWPSGALAGVDFVFAFVRHPVTYCESNWKVRRYPRVHPIHIARFKKFSRKSPREASRFMKGDFGEWVAYMLENRPCWITRLYEQFVGPEYGEFCHFIGRMETLEDDFSRLMSLLGHKRQVRRNRSRLRSMGKLNRSGSTPEWPPGLKERVEHDERLAIERYYGEATHGKRFYSSLDEIHKRCLRSSNRTIRRLRSKLYGKGGQT